VATGTVRSVALAADGRTVALAEDDGTTQLRDATSGELLQRFRPETTGPIPGPRDGLVFSPNGALVTMGGSWDGTVPLWDVRTGRLLRTLTVSSGLIHSVVVSPDGKTLAAAARDESIRVLDVGTGRTRHIVSRPHGDAGITTVEFAPDARTILSAATDGTICCWPLP
jgi:WD40 repeat protein